MFGKAGAVELYRVNFFVTVLSSSTFLFLLSNS